MPLEWRKRGLLMISVLYGKVGFQQFDTILFKNSIQTLQFFCPSSIHGRDSPARLSIHNLTKKVGLCAGFVF